jgi:phosphosulfolactate synthase
MYIIYTPEDLHYKQGILYKPNLIKEMMHIDLPNVPDRTKKDRKNGLTIISDFGLRKDEIISIVSEKSRHIDLLKFHASLFTGPDLHEKVKILKAAKIHPFFSGTLFEIFYVRGMLDSYLAYLKNLGLTHIEISDSNFEMDPSIKLSIISKLAKDFVVISEVGAKHSDVIFPLRDWKQKINDEFEAGAWKVTLEGGEYGNSGIYDKNYLPKQSLVQSLLNLNQDHLIWETRHTAQQVWFVNRVGPNVNLGDIDERDVLKLESIRLGLNTHTFFNSIPESQANELRKRLNPMLTIDFQI